MALSGPHSGAKYEGYENVDASLQPLWLLCMRRSSSPEVVDASLIMERSQGL